MAGQPRRKTALVLHVIQGMTKVAKASRTVDLDPSEVEQWVDEGEVKRAMENALRARPVEVKEQYEKPLRDQRGLAGMWWMAVAVAGEPRKTARTAFGQMVLAGRP